MEGVGFHMGSLLLQKQAKPGNILSHSAGSTQTREIGNYFQRSVGCLLEREMLKCYVSH